MLTDFFPLSFGTALPGLATTGAFVHLTFTFSFLFFLFLNLYWMSIEVSFLTIVKKMPLQHST